MSFFKSWIRRAIARDGADIRIHDLRRVDAANEVAKAVPLLIVVA
jgi:hypothetical protein